MTRQLRLALHGLFVVTALVGCGARNPDGSYDFEQHSCSSNGVFQSGTRCEGNTVLSCEWVGGSEGRIGTTTAFNCAHRCVDEGGAAHCDDWALDARCSEPAAQSSSQFCEGETSAHCWKGYVWRRQSCIATAVCSPTNGCTAR